MEEDYKTTLRMSSNATVIADKIVSSGKFEDRLSVFQFAFAYAIKTQGKNLNPELLDSKYDAGGSTYNIGSLDSDGFLEKIILLVYPNCKTPYRYIRGIMIYGTECLGELLDNGKLFPISQHM